MVMRTRGGNRVDGEGDGILRTVMSLPGIDVESPLSLVLTFQLSLSPPCIYKSVVRFLHSMSFRGGDSSVRSWCKLLAGDNPAQLGCRIQCTVQRRCQLATGCALNSRPKSTALIGALRQRTRKLSRSLANGEPDSSSISKPSLESGWFLTSSHHTRTVACKRHIDRRLRRRNQLILSISF